jgi:hypothetical protein
MKRTYTGWLSRDGRGDLFLGQNKPNCDCGYWVNMGENMQLPDCDFPEVTFENSPRKVSVTIEDADERYKEEYHVDGRLSKAIADLPCIIGTCKGFFNQHYYIFQWQGFTTLVKKGDVIARRENGDWIVRSR